MMSNYETDFSPHAITTEQLMRGMHDAFLKGDYEKAVEKGTKALVELRLAVTAIKALTAAKTQRE